MTDILPKDREAAEQWRRGIGRKYNKEVDILAGYIADHRKKERVVSDTLVVGSGIYGGGDKEGLVGFGGTKVVTETHPVDGWLAQGRKLQAEGKLPAGVTLPEPEIDYERYREALEVWCEQRGVNLPRTPLDNLDKGRIHALIAAMPFMPKD